jgi:hypothetical protein
LGLKNRKKIARKELGKNETQNIAANGLGYDFVASGSVAERHSGLLWFSNR